MARYASISDHGLIGDLQTAALVTTDGRWTGSAVRGSIRLACSPPCSMRTRAVTSASRQTATTLAFLMPRSSVLAQGLRDATATQILRAKSVWKVAAMALTHRLYELDLLTDWGYRTICVQLSRLGYRRSEPGGIPRESSQLLSKVFRSIREDGEKPAAIAAAIGVTSTELQEHVFGLTLTTLPGGQHHVAVSQHNVIHLVRSPDHS